MFCHADFFSINYSVEFHNSWNLREVVTKGRAAKMFNVMPLGAFLCRFLQIILFIPLQIKFIYSQSCLLFNYSKELHCLVFVGCLCTSFSFLICFLYCEALGTVCTDSHKGRWGWWTMYSC